MASRTAFAFVPVVLAEPCLSPGATLKAWCQLQETGVPLADAITPQPSVMSVIGIVVTKPFPDTCCLWIGVDIPQRIQDSPVIFWSNCCGVIPSLPKMPATTRKAIQCHRLIPANPMHQLWQFTCIIRTQKQVQVIAIKFTAYKRWGTFCLALVSTANSTSLLNPLAIRNWQLLHLSVMSKEWLTGR